MSKNKNTVSENFVKLAYDNVVPITFTSRDSLLMELSTDDNTALLVADGMGAEYYPLLLSMAKRKGINVQSATITKTRMPSSTEFNKIDWQSDRRLKGRNGIDNVFHYGAKKHENSSPEENLCATFDNFDILFNSIQEGLSSYERVVVTADHGSSRLACIAHEKELSRTLSWRGKSDSILSCRYTLAPNNVERPSDFEPFYDEDNSKEYWIMRGYNRLPKKGGYSVHGGATLEECLVPVIVFSKKKTDTEVKVLVKKSAEQLVEKMEFIDI